MPCLNAALSTVSSGSTSNSTSTGDSRTLYAHTMQGLFGEHMRRGDPFRRLWCRHARFFFVERGRGGICRRVRDLSYMD
jgi:hypothetical protein